LVPSEGTKWWLAAAASKKDEKAAAAAAAVKRDYLANGEGGRIDWARGALMDRSRVH